MGPGGRGRAGRGGRPRATWGGSPAFTPWVAGPQDARSPGAPSLPQWVRVDRMSPGLAAQPGVRLSIPGPCGQRVMPTRIVGGKGCRDWAVAVGRAACVCGASHFCGASLLNRWAPRLRTALKSESGGRGGPLLLRPGSVPGSAPPTCPTWARPSSAPEPQVGLQPVPHRREAPRAPPRRKFLPEHLCVLFSLSCFVCPQMAPPAHLSPHLPEEVCSPGGGMS